MFATLKETSGGKGTVLHAELDSAKTSLDPKPIEEILGVKGQMASGVYKVTIGAPRPCTAHEVGNAMGVNTWAAFVGMTRRPWSTAILPCSSRSSKPCSRHYAVRAFMWWRSIST